MYLAVPKMRRMHLFLEEFVLFFAAECETVADELMLVTVVVVVVDVASDEDAAGGEVCDVGNGYGGGEDAEEGYGDLMGDGGEEAFGCDSTLYNGTPDPLPLNLGGITGNVLVHLKCLCCCATYYT